ncbi:MAG: alpha/beta hydrolase [Myxococcota bacterium]|nr:alpha/beta hydrolase [Myxococcota bacterium]
MKKAARVFALAAEARLRRAGIRGRYYGEPGQRIHVYEGAGAPHGPRCVVLHGIGSLGTTYAPLLRRLVKHTAWLAAPELPGHGFSDVPSAPMTSAEHLARMTALLDQIIDQPVMLVGHSMGGALALRYALARPQKVAALVLCSPAGAPMDEAAWQGLRADFRIETAQDGRAFMRRLLHRPRPYHLLAGRHIAELLNRPTIQHVFDSITPDQFLTPQETSRLAMPTLLIWGQSERILPHSCLAWYKSNMPSHVRIVEPDNYGHSPPLEQPRDYAQRILDFAREACRTPGDARP